MKTISQVSAELSMPYWKITHLHKSGRLPFPAMFAGRYAYSETDIQAIKDYFERIDDGRPVFRETKN